MKVRFLRPIYFLWFVVPVSGYLALTLFGTPHVAWTRSWHFSGADQARFYTRCTYVGPYGAYTIHFPADGKCRFLRFFKRGKDGA